MVLGGTSVWIAAALLAAWFSLLCLAAWRNFARASASGVRVRITAIGLIASAIAVLAALLLDLSWISPDVSQKMGFSASRILAMLLFWPSVAGLFLCVGGVGGRVRFASAASSLLTGFWWLMLMMGSGISVGGVPIARHPVVYLIPNGYIGWVKVKRGEDAPPLPLLKGKFICTIPLSGVISTSTLIEDGWAKDEYFYYDGKQQVRELHDTGWSNGGMIWDSMTEFGATSPDSRHKQVVESAFVGTEDQYRHLTHQNRSHL